MLKAVGELVWLDGEELLNAVTAVSGSGPAYVFLLAEALAAAAERIGLHPMSQQPARAQNDRRRRCAARSNRDRRPPTCGKSVTSPGGTTEAALKVLMADARFEQLLAEAIAAANARGFELAKTR